MSLTSVEESGHLLTSLRVLALDDLDLLSALEDGLSELADLGCEVFLVDHVKARDELGESLVLEVGADRDVVEHFLDVLDSDDF